MSSLGICKRGRSHFVWTERELLIVIRKFKFPYQGKFKKNGKYQKIGFISHLNQLIKETLGGEQEQKVDKIVRFPSEKAIESKIRDCFILSKCRDPTQRIFRVSKLHQDLWLMERDRRASIFNENAL